MQAKNELHGLAAIPRWHDLKDEVLSLDGRGSERMLSVLSMGRFIRSAKDEWAANPLRDKHAHHVEVTSSLCRALRCFLGRVNEKWRLQHIVYAGYLPERSKHIQVHLRHIKYIFVGLHKLLRQLLVADENVPVIRVLVPTRTRCHERAAPLVLERFIAKHAHHVLSRGLPCTRDRCRRAGSAHALRTPARHLGVAGR